MTDAITRTRRAALRAGLMPPPRLDLPDWAELNIHLPEEVTAAPGRLRLLSYQRGILEAIGDPAIERVSVVSAVRVGKTSAVTSAVLAMLVNEPCPVMVLVPTDSDARNFVVFDLDPIAEASPVTRGLLSMEGSGRNTLTDRRVPGGSLKVRAAKSPRNLRAHTVRVLLIDEADAMEPTAEGDPLALAERRTLSYANRKIVTVSTPTIEETSNILRAYRRSDQRIFEIPCPGCGTYFELLWRHIEWPDGRPQDAYATAPCCGTVITPRDKPAAVTAGRWRATRPEVKGHAGFRLNALVSPLANAAWGKLAVEFIEAKRQPETLQVFVNTILAEGWREAAEEADPSELAGRAEAFGLEAIPPEALLVTVGVDVQHDRFECTFLSHGRDGLAHVLGHVLIWGSPGDDSTWIELDALLRTTWPHPKGGTLKVDAAAIDSGDGAWTAKVYDFTRARFARKVVAIKGASGKRPPIARANTKGALLFIVGVDGLKSQIFQRLARGSSIRFSDTLDAEYFEQVASERLVVRHVRGAPVHQFVRVPGRRAEALDCLVYALAARHLVTANLDQREAELSSPQAPKRPERVIRNSWLEGR